MKTSVSALQILLAACDKELTRLGMQINEKSRYAYGLVHALTRTVKTYRLAHGGSLQWSSQFRYGCVFREWTSF